MGFMRKALFVGTGGLSGMAGVRANSKKERTAKAAEKQVRLQKQTRVARPTRTTSTVARTVRSGDHTASELERLAALHGRGALTDAEFSAAKGKLLGTQLSE
jgi:hypothetical protein